MVVTFVHAYIDIFSLEYINESDYSSIAIPVTFEPCDMRKCISVTITDDLT